MLKTVAPLVFGSIFGLENHLSVASSRTCLSLNGTKVASSKIASRTSQTPPLGPGVGFPPPPSSPAETAQLQSLTAILQHIRLTSNSDSWSWGLDSSGSFSVSSISKHIQDAYFGPPHWLFPWNPTAPIKSNILCWRIEQDRIPTRDQLDKRNIPIPSKDCPFCRNHVETSEHLFLHCEFTRYLWSLTSSWCKAPSRHPASLHELFSLHRDPMIDPRKAARVNLVTIAFCSIIWKQRNDAIFNNRSPSISLAFKDLKSLSFLWLSSREKTPRPSWEDWNSFNFV